MHLQSREKRARPADDESDNDVDHVSKYHEPVVRGRGRAKYDPQAARWLSPSRQQAPARRSKKKVNTFTEDNMRQLYNDGHVHERRYDDEPEVCAILFPV